MKPIRSNQCRLITLHAVKMLSLCQHYDLDDLHLILVILCQDILVKMMTQNNNMRVKSILDSTEGFYFPTLKAIKLKRLDGKTIMNRKLDCSPRGLHNSNGLLLSELLLPKIWPFKIVTDMNVFLCDILTERKAIKNVLHCCFDFVFGKQLIQFNTWMQTSDHSILFSKSQYF